MSDILGVSDEILLGKTVYAKVEGTFIPSCLIATFDGFSREVISSTNAVCRYRNAPLSTLENDILTLLYPGTYRVIFHVTFSIDAGDDVITNEKSAKVTGEYYRNGTKVKSLIWNKNITKIDDCFYNEVSQFSAGETISFKFYNEKAGATRIIAIIVKES